jgi:DNA-damage-inducible protein J
MTNPDTYVRVRIDVETRERASRVLEGLGLSISDAIQLLMHHIADEQKLPFDREHPNRETQQAIDELKQGKGERFDSVEALMVDLESED